ncbi:Hypothetical predicted protein, partial [Pelobates cultripes]
QSYIAKVVDGEGTLRHTTEEIAKAFSTFYDDLYNFPKPTGNRADLPSYVKTYIKHTITSELRDTLESPFTVEEVESAIKSLPG